MCQLTTTVQATTTGLNDAKTTKTERKALTGEHNALGLPFWVLFRFQFSRQLRLLHMVVVLFDLVEVARWDV